MAKSTICSNGRGNLLIFTLVLFGIGIFVYGSALSILFSVVLHRQGSSHGIFVPFLSGYILWLKRDKIKKISPQMNWQSGAAVIVVGSVLLFLSKHSEYSLVFEILSFLCISGGLILSLFGRALFKETAFPLFFLATMIPIPQEIYAQIADWMRMLSTWGSVLVTKSFGVPLHREGFLISLPDTNLIVDKSCSGIRYLLSYFTFGIVYAVLFKKSIAARLTVILCSIPLALFGSIIRLSVIFLAAHFISPVMAEPQPHIYLSWAVFVIVLFGIISVDRFLSRTNN